MGLSLITVLEIATNDHEINTFQNKESGKWGSVLYMVRDGRIHKSWCSYDGCPFDAEEKAIEAMNDVVKSAKDYVEGMSADRHKKRVLEGGKP